LLIFVIQGTMASARGEADGVLAALRAVISLGGIMTVLSVFLFPVVWND
jgi:hypothetical protein